MMMNCLEGEIMELKSVGDIYFSGDMSDKEARDQFESIENKYKPVFDALLQATSDGELNWKQHKKQIKLFNQLVKA